MASEAYQSRGGEGGHSGEGGSMSSLSPQLSALLDLNLPTAFGSLDTLVQQARAGIAELFAELLELTMTEEHARKLLEALGFGDALRDALRALAESRANAADGTEGGEGAETI